MEYATSTRDAISGEMVIGFVFNKARQENAGLGEILIIINLLKTVTMVAWRSER